MPRTTLSQIQKKWEERIQQAKKAHQDWMDESKVELAREYFKGKQNPGYSKDEWITINKIYSHLKARLPSLYAIDPYFYVKLKKSFSPIPADIARFDQKGRGRQAMLNYLKVELELKTKARLSIQDAHFSYGVIKVHFAADEMENPDAEKEIQDDNQQVLLDQEGNPLLEPKTIPINERYVITRIHPDDLIWDVDAGPLEDKWHFLAERIRMTREEAEQDKRFAKRKLDAIQAVADEREKEKSGTFSRFTSFFRGSETNAKDKDEELLTFWEIYDLDHKQWLMIAEGAEVPMIKPTDLAKGVEKHPYGILRFTLPDNSPYPITPVSQMMDPQKEYNLARSRILTHRKRFNRKYEVVQNLLMDETEASKLETGDDGTFIMVQAKGAVTPIQDAALDQQSYTELALLNSDIVEIMGNPDHARAIASADSATEASLLDRRLEIREGDDMSLVIDWILVIARKLDQLVQANISRDEAVRIVGPEGENWQMIRESDFQNIEGEFEYSVNVGASSPRLPDIERSQWIAFLSQVVIPFPHILTAPNVMRRMAEMFHIEDEASLEEFRQLGLKIMQGQLPQPGAQGSQAGVSQQNPVSQILGAALGSQGGNTNGGGSQLQ